MKLKIYSIALFFFIVGAMCVAQPFKPGSLWLDNEGNHINAHGGAILYHEGLYYWYGEHKNEYSGAALDGVSCYSSEDLYHWTREGIALAVVDDEHSPIVSGCTMERPKVVYNKNTKMFVMWFHLELKGMGYSAAQSGVAVSSSPKGPFRFIEAKRVNAGHYPLNFPDAYKVASVAPEAYALLSRKEQRGRVLMEGYLVRRDLAGGQMARDMTVYVDKDGKAYHVFASEENATLHVCELTDDYQRHTGRYIRVAVGESNEAPAVFFHSNYYWMITSGCTGWAPNQARLLRSRSMLGDWEYVGDPCRHSPEENSLLTFRSQSTFVFPIVGKKGEFIFMADRWNDKNLKDSRYVWLPVQFDNQGVPYLEWRSEWRY